MLQFISATTSSSCSTSWISNKNFQDFHPTADDLNDDSRLTPVAPLTPVAKVITARQGVDNKLPDLRK